MCTFLCQSLTVSHSCYFMVTGAMGAVGSSGTCTSLDSLDSPSALFNILDTAPVIDSRTGSTTGRLEMSVLQQCWWNCQPHPLGLSDPGGSSTKDSGGVACKHSSAKPPPSQIHLLVCPFPPMPYPQCVGSHLSRYVAWWLTTGHYPVADQGPCME